MRAVIPVIITVSLRVMVGGTRWRDVDPFLLPLPHWTREDGGRSVASRGPAEPGPNALHSSNRRRISDVSADRLIGLCFSLQRWTWLWFPSLGRIQWYINSVGVNHSRWKRWPFSKSDRVFYFDYDCAIIRFPLGGRVCDWAWHLNFVGTSCIFLYLV